MSFVVQTTDSDFSQSGLAMSPVVRLGFLATLPAKDRAGVLGHIFTQRNEKVKKSLIAASY